MDNPVKGNLILKEVNCPDGGARLLQALQRIFPSARPEQLQGLFSRPKPLVLSKNISEINARKLADLLFPHGAILEFMPETLRAETSEEPLPIRAPAPPTAAHPQAHVPATSPTPAPPPGP